MPAKRDVIDAIERALQGELTTLVRTTSDALDEATRPENRAENKYDTRGLEASYLAGAQSERLLALKQLIAFYGVVDRADQPEGATAKVGSLVEAEEQERPVWFFLAPGGGGKQVSVGEVAITVLSGTSPLGRVLVGRRAGDEVTVETPKSRRVLEVIGIS